MSINTLIIQFDDNPNATKWGEFSLQVTASNGFGLNPLAILENRNVDINNTGLAISLYGKLAGHIEGQLHATDFARMQADGRLISNIHGVISTTDRQKIAVKMLGEIDATGKVTYQIKLNHNGENYAFVNELTLFATGRAIPGHLMTLSVYAFEQDPLEGSGVSLTDPDVSTVDYANFPYTLEQLQADDAATIIYAGNGHLNNVEAFGVDVNDVFTGKVAIPADGLRMNGYFSGVCGGSVNGVISGVNYLKVMPDGSMRMNSKIIASTLNHETLLLEALGASFPQTGSAWWETSTAVSNLEQYAHLTQLHNVGVGSTDVQTGNIVYNHYGYASNPF